MRARVRVRVRVTVRVRVRVRARARARARVHLLGGPGKAHARLQRVRVAFRDVHLGGRGPRPVGAAGGGAGG